MVFISAAESKLGYLVTDDLTNELKRRNTAKSDQVSYVSQVTKFYKESLVNFYVLF